MILNSDYRDILHILSEKKVKFPPILSISDLIINKRSTGRLKDLADVETLEKGLL